MPIIENHAFVDDPWTDLADADQVPSGGFVIVPHARLEGVLNRTPHDARGLAVDIANDVAVESLAHALDRLDMVVLNMPAFTDGRAFSQARSLRSTLGFKGTIRVRGDFLPDQYGFLLQAGVDSFVVDDRFTLDEWVGAARAVPATYQRDYATSALATRTIVDAEPWPEQPHYG